MTALTIVAGAAIHFFGKSEARMLIGQHATLGDLRKISEEGVAFQSPINGDRMFLTPEESMAIQRVLDSSKAIYDLWGPTPPNNAMDMMFGRQVDRAAMVLIALSKTPDQALARDAHTHFLTMITENRRPPSLTVTVDGPEPEWK